MDKKTEAEIRKFLKKTFGRTEDPNSENPLTPEEIKTYAQLRISGMLDEYDYVQESRLEKSKPKSKYPTFKEEYSK